MKNSLWNVWRAVLRCYVKQRRYSQVFSWLLWPLWYAFTRLCMGLDVVFFPGLRRVKIERPVFIVGFARSGTTFFQQLLGQTGEFAMFETWQMLFPSLIQRKLAWLWVQSMERRQTDQLLTDESGHPVRLRSVDEDEGLFLNCLDTELVLPMMCPWLLIDPQYRDLALSMADEHREPPARVRASLRFYKACWQRQVYATGRTQVVAKVNPMVMRLETCLQLFPDARIVCLVRDPIETIASFFSMQHKLIRTQGMSDADQRAYLEQKYHYCVEFYRRFEEIKAMIPPEQLLILPFEKMRADPQAAAQAVFDFAGLVPSDELRRRIAEVAAQPYRRHHENHPLEAWGLDEAQVHRDLAFVWETCL